MYAQVLKVLLYCPSLLFFLSTLEMSRINNSHWLSFTQVSCSLPGDTEEAEPSNEEGKKLFLSAARHVLDYFKYAHKYFKFPLA